MRDTLRQLAPWAALLVLLIGTGLWALSPPARETAAPAPVRTPRASSPSPAAGGGEPARPSAPADTSQPAAATPEPLSAEQLTRRAQQQLAHDPASALRDIEQADELAGSQDETRRALEIHALVRLGKVGLARTLTDRFYRSFPNSDRAAELERLTGYHPRPHGP